jgi:taurine transport system permease protein
MAVERLVVLDRTAFLRRPDYRAVRVLALLGLVLTWELLTRTGWVSSLFLPSPSGVLEEGLDMVRSGQLFVHLLKSLERLAWGFGIGALAGVGVGVAVGFFALADAVVQPIIAATFPIPKIALLPLLILWFGIGEPSKVATIALGVFFPTVISAYSACDSVPRNLIRMGQSFGLPGRDIVRKILLPGAMPGILAGFRISASVALLLVVAAEMIGAQYGIGAFVLAAGNLMQTDQLVAGVVMLSILGLLISWGLSLVERAVLRWR